MAFKKTYNDSDYLSRYSKEAKWVNKVIDKEYEQNKKEYIKNGSLMFGASITVAKRLENKFRKETDIEKKKFLSRVLANMQKNIFD